MKDIHSFILEPNKQILSTQYVLGTIIKTGGTLLNMTEKVFHLIESLFQLVDQYE